VCRRENVGTNLKFLAKLGKSGSEIRKMLVQVHADNAMKKTVVYKWVTIFLKEEKVSLTKKDQDGQQGAELKKKNIANFVKLFVKIVGCQEHSTASEHRQRNS
jgi:hypothetical protein